MFGPDLTRFGLNSPFSQKNAAEKIYKRVSRDNFIFAHNVYMVILYTRCLFEMIWEKNWILWSEYDLAQSGHVRACLLVNGADHVNHKGISCACKYEVVIFDGSA